MKNMKFIWLLFIVTNYFLKTIYNDAKSPKVADNIFQIKSGE